MLKEGHAHADGCYDQSDAVKAGELRRRDTNRPEIMMGNPPKSTDYNGTSVSPRGELLSEIMRMASVFWASPARNRLLAMAATLITIVAATAYGQTRLNAWNQPFYDALTRKDPAAFFSQLFVFGRLATALLALNVAQAWLSQNARVLLRQCIVEDLLNEWLKPARAFRLSIAGSSGANPDQRLQADAQHLSDLVTDLLVGLLQSTILLLSFIGVLWVLSEHMSLPLAGRQLHVPGYMVWCALLYAVAASLLSWRVGRPLTALNAERYAREAELRFALVRVNEEIEGITIHGGEGGERTLLNGAFRSVFEISRRIASAKTRLTWVTAGYGWFTMVAPILVAAPSYMSSSMTFGELMMVVGAFNQVQASLRWFIDNSPTLADWRATRQRVGEFQTAVIGMDHLGQGSQQIELQETEGGSIVLDNLRVAAPAYSIGLNESHVELEQGERTLIAANQAPERAVLLHAISGIWPWGTGWISRPRRQSMMFLPAHAYVPPGTLSAAISYPHPSNRFDDGLVSKALADVGLSYLQPSLETTDRWDRRLSEIEKQCLAFARVIIQRPHWLVLDGTLDALDLTSRERIEHLIASQLPDIGIVNIGQENDATEKFFTRRIFLVKDPQGPTFQPTEPLPVST
jgi:putative ATP-binding cassette transporter